MAPAEVNGTAPLLTEERLEALAARWREQGAPIADDLRPGLDNGALDDATVPLGLRLPTEARVLWGWHDGTESSLTSHAIGLDLLFLSLGDAVARYRQEDAAAGVAVGDGSPPEETWQATWFPVAARGDGAVMACDCSIPEGAPTPIRYVHWDKSGSGSRVPVAPSLGTVAAWWIEAIDSGAWHYSPQRMRWEADPGRLSNPTLERTGLV
jgi:cell wall assembly regulator SMI1